MKKLFTLFAALLLWHSAANCETPAITMTTTKAIGSVFMFKLLAKTDDTPVKVDFGNGTLVDRTISGSFYETTIGGTLVGSQTIKVYGIGITSLACNDNNLSALDVSGNTNLAVIDCRNNQIATLDITKNIELIKVRCDSNQLAVLDVSKNIALTNLDCYHNRLTMLDLSKNTKLKWLNCYGNLLTALDLSKNIALQMLICVTNQITTLNVSKNIALTDLLCGYNKLTVLDVSGCNALTNIQCRHNQIAAMDVTKNTLLIWLICSYNKLTSINVSMNTKLQELECNNNIINVLDLSKNTDLGTIYCENNQLTALDISKNTLLRELWCKNNKISVLDVSKNTELVYLYCENNLLTFETLPLKQAAWYTYSYSPQNPVSKNIASGTNSVIDLSSLLTINGITTIYTWKTKSGTTLIEGTDYTLTNGKTVFLKAQTDSVYCEMTNATFPDFTGGNVLKTTCTKVSAYVGIEEYAPVTSFQIYAGNKTIYIDASTKGQASVYDISGRLVATKEITVGDNTIDLLKGGVYLVKFAGNHSPKTKKLFIEN